MTGNAAVMARALMITNLQSIFIAFSLLFAGC
jgi:hypothetical protein